MTTYHQDPAADISHLIIVGDTQRTSRLEFWRKANDADQMAVLDAIEKRRPQAIIHLGDMVTWGCIASDWLRFDTLFQRFQHIPLLPVQGNHDWFGGSRALPFIHKRFPRLRDGGWYSFTASGLGIVALESNFSRIGKDASEAQLQWLQTQVSKWDADTCIKGIIGYCHNPPFTNSKIVKPSTQVRDDFLASLSQSPKSMALWSGHCHAYEHFVEEGMHCFVSGGGGGPYQTLECRPHKRRYHEHFANQESMGFAHFCELKIKASEGLFIDIVRCAAGAEPKTIDSIQLPWKANAPHQ